MAKRCVMCGQPRATLWTLDNMKQAVVTYLCKDDAAPLQAIMEAAGELPPSEQVPMPDRDMVIHARGRRQPKMAPLLNWTPPDAARPPAQEERPDTQEAGAQ